MIITIYDWCNAKTKFSVNEADVKSLLVVVNSGDEIVEVSFKDGRIEKHDASNDREADIWDGCYTVGESRLKEFAEWRPPVKGLTYSYQRRNAFWESP